MTNWVIPTGTPGAHSRFADRDRGKFFTPYATARLMAALTGGPGSPAVCAGLLPGHEAEAVTRAGAHGEARRAVLLVDEPFNAPDATSDEFVRAVLRAGRRSFSPATA